MRINKKFCYSFFKFFISTVALLSAIYLFYINISFSWFGSSKSVMANGITISAASLDNNITTFIELYEYSEATDTYELLQIPEDSLGPIQYFTWLKNNQPYYFISQENKIEKKYKVTITQTMLSDINYIEMTPSLSAPQGIKTLMLGYSTTQTGAITQIDFNTLTGNITITPDSVRNITDTEILSKYGTGLVSAVQADIYFYLSTNLELDTAAVDAYMSANGYTGIDIINFSNELDIVLHTY